MTTIASRYNGSSPEMTTCPASRPNDQTTNPMTDLEIQNDRGKSIVLISFFALLCFLTASVAVVMAADADVILEVAKVNPERAEELVQVWSNYHLIMLCLAGSILGTLLKISWNPSADIAATPEAQAKLLARKALTSLCTGVAFTPLVLRYFGWKSEEDAIVWVAALVAFCADTILTNLSAKVAEWNTRRKDQP